MEDSDKTKFEPCMFSRKIEILMKFDSGDEGKQKMSIVYFSRYA